MYVAVKVSIRGYNIGTHFYVSISSLGQGLKCTYKPDRDVACGSERQFAHVDLGVNSREMIPRLRRLPLWLSQLRRLNQHTLIIKLVDANTATITQSMKMGNACDMRIGSPAVSDVPEASTSGAIVPFDKEVSGMMLFDVELAAGNLTLLVEFIEELGVGIERERSVVVVKLVAIL